MTDHDKAVSIADHLRKIMLDVIVTAEDILSKCRSAEELGFYYEMLRRPI
ncbi:MAG: hypothetical protein K6G20_04175 [Ruminococcus sp.]|nr:hypothetical protein [Ruminococcus sp.]